jgi:hypothetical protein
MAASIGLNRLPQCNAQGWERALQHAQAAAAAVRAALPAALPPGRGAAARRASAGGQQLGGPNAGTLLTMLSLETGELTATLVGPAHAGPPLGLAAF